MSPKAGKRWVGSYGNLTEGGHWVGRMSLVRDCRMIEIYKLLDRIAEGLSERFEITLDPTSRDDCRYSAHGGRVSIIGKDRNCICRGIYEYLRRFCGLNFTWTHQSAEILPILPDAPQTIVTSPYRHRLYMNMCTFGYSTVWWDWDRWEREIEWMALHGINRPLAMCGQEAIWVQVWNEFGIRREQLDDFFTGPAYLPWNRCGNLNGFDGPLPESWIESQRILQKKIIEKMAALDIVPVVPAFSGYVPNALSKLYPGEKIYTSSQWANFEDQYRSRLLSTQSPLFLKISERFIRIYEAEYGRQKYFLVDVFHENNPMNMEGDVCRELAEYGRSIYRGIKAGNPEGIWVMQGWSFYFNDTFWTKDNVEALFSKVPAREVIVIDLCNERFSGWQKFDGYGGREWIYSFVHNFGGNDLLNGDLRFFAEHTGRMLRQNVSPAGFGISPEGIENNEVVYELLTDLAWSREEIRIEPWLQRYCSTRYGRAGHSLYHAWNILLDGTYCCNNTNIKHGFQHRPSPQVLSSLSNSGQLREVLRVFLENLEDNGPLLVYDAIEILSQYGGILCDKGLQLAYNDLSDWNIDQGWEVADRVFALLHEMDRLMGVVPGRSLHRWCSSAKAFGRTAEEKAYYVRDAKRLLSIWGNPILTDYAARMWSGLIYGYYAARWQAFFMSLTQQKDFDAAQWEAQWIAKDDLPEQEDRDFDVIAAIRNTFEALVRFDDWLKNKNVLCHSRKIGRWASRDYASVRVDVSEVLSRAGRYLFKIEQDPGMTMPPVKEVRLSENSQDVGRCERVNGAYEINVFDRKPGAAYSLVVNFGNCNTREAFGDFWMSCTELKDLHHNRDVEILGSIP